MNQFQWNSGNLLTLGWSDAEELLCVQDDGLVLIYNMFGQYLHAFSMGQEAKDTKIIDAKIFASNSGTGVAVMTTNFRIFLINSIKEPKNRQLPEMPSNFHLEFVWENETNFPCISIAESVLDPTCWAIINEDRNTYSLVARKHEIFKLNQGYDVCSVQNVSFENTFDSIIAMSVSFNYRFLALYTNNGIVWMGTSDMEKKYCEFKTNQSERPKQIEWLVHPYHFRYLFNVED